MSLPHMRHELLYGNIRLFAGSGSTDLAQEIAEYLSLPLCGREVIEFPNENLFVKLQSSVRGQDCYVIQTTSQPVHRNLMELLILLQTLKLDSAGRVTAVVPYMCYGRSDRKDQPRVPITARLVADMIQAAGADRYILVDLHAGQIQGFYSIPGDVLTGSHIIKKHFQELLPTLHRPVVLTADLGFAKKGRGYSAALNIPLAFIEKRRIANAAMAEALTIIGDVNDRDVILVDDEVDTGGSMVEAVEIAKKLGARDVYMAFIHPVFSRNCVDRLVALPVKQFVTTNTIPVLQANRDKFEGRLKILSIAPLLGEVIRRANEGRSVGAMFNE